jgi:hypothetical protein
MDERIQSALKQYAVVAVLAGMAGCGGGGSSGNAPEVSKAPDPDPAPITYPAPVLESADWQGDKVALSWSYPGSLPQEGFDIIVNGTDTDEANRTQVTQAVLGPFDTGSRQCFRIEAQYPAAGQFPVSSRRCVDAVEGDAPPENSAPVISGEPAGSVVAGEPYRFTPSASDADGDALTFTVAGLPVWAAFDANTGEVSGTPGEADAGTYENIVITVSDGQADAALAAFSIDVVTAGNASVTLQWTPPTQREDGTPLEDLAGYRVYWGQDSEQLDRSEDVGNGGVSSYVIEGLIAGTWYVGVSAYDGAGMESQLSDVVEAVVN